MQAITISSKTAALISGWSLVLMAVAAGLAFGYLRGLNYLPDDPAASLLATQSNTAQLYLEFALWVLILALDVMVAWSLGQFFKAKQAQRASVIMGLRLAYSAVLAWAIIQLLPLLTGAVGLSADGILAQRAAFDQIWSYGLIVFGLHLVVLGQAVARDSRVPNAWAYLLYIAGGSYTFLNLMSQYKLIPVTYLEYLESILALPMTIGELGFAVWLLWAVSRRKI